MGYIQIREDEVALGLINQYPHLTGFDILKLLEKAKQKPDEYILDTDFIFMENSWWTS